MIRLASAIALSMLAAWPATAQYVAIRVTPDAQAARFEVPKAAEAALPTARAHLTTKGAQWVAMETQKVRSGAIQPSQVAVDAGTVAGGVMQGADIAELAFVVLMQATQDQDNDLQQIMAETKAANNSKAALRSQMQAEQRSAASASRDSVSDMSQMQQMRLQMAMDRRSKMMEALSNIMKKLSDTDNSIIKNMK